MEKKYFVVRFHLYHGRARDGWHTLSTVSKKSDKKEFTSLASAKRRAKHLTRVTGDKHTVVQSVCEFTAEVQVNVDCAK